MKWRPLHVISVFLIFISLFGSRAYAQPPTNCFEITSILVDACAPANHEGENEMFRFWVGPNPLTVSNLTVTWPSNSFL